MSTGIEQYTKFGIKIRSVNTLQRIYHERDIGCQIITVKHLSLVIKYRITCDMDTEIRANKTTANTDKLGTRNAAKCPTQSGDSLIKLIAQNN